MFHDCEDPNCSRCNPEPDEPVLLLDVDYDDYDRTEGVERDYESTL